MAVEIPANAFLDSSGQRWECQRGFRRELDSCHEIDLPANAHLDYSGHGWACNRGFERDGEVCTERRVQLSDARDTAATDSNQDELMSR